VTDNAKEEDKGQVSKPAKEEPGTRQGPPIVPDLQFNGRMPPIDPFLQCVGKQPTAWRTHHEAS
jgi:hypothetical protein